jgi:hypothetical protein
MQKEETSSNSASAYVLIRLALVLAFGDILPKLRRIVGGLTLAEGRDAKDDKLLVRQVVALVLLQIDNLDVRVCAFVCEGELFTDAGMTA